MIKSFAARTSLLGEISGTGLHSSQRQVMEGSKNIVVKTAARFLAIWVIYKKTNVEISVQFPLHPVQIRSKPTGGGRRGCLVKDRKLIHSPETVAFFSHGGNDLWKSLSVSGRDHMEQGHHSTEMMFFKLIHNCTD